jgi:AmiR/NasT family two-component response regulator
MNDEQAPSRQVRESERVLIAEGILCERHGISITDAVILLAAMADARGKTATTLASQIMGLFVIERGGLTMTRSSASA